MDVMQRRRELLAMQTTVLDTSPIIAQYDKRISVRNDVDAEDFCITQRYYYPPSDAFQTLAYFGTDGAQCRVYKNDEYMDYWTLAVAQSPRECINIGSDAIAITLSMFKLDESYAYIVETGQIFFAGKNTPYYGHRNISELN